MQTYLALLIGFALLMTSRIIGPVKRAVERPAAPQEKPFDLRTWFCSLRRLPAHTSVMGAVIWSNSCRICLKSSVMGFSTSLCYLLVDKCSKIRPRCVEPLNAEFPGWDVFIPNVRDRPMISNVE